MTSKLSAIDQKMNSGWRSW